MTVDTGVTNVDPTDGTPEGQAGAADPVAAESPANAPAPAAAPRSWSMPKSPVTREHADQLGRRAVDVVVALGRAIAGILRLAARALRRLWRMVEGVPPAVRAFAAAAVLMLLGIVGAIALRDTLGLFCTVVVIPVSASVLGALGHRWYGGSGVAAQPGERVVPPLAPDLTRSLEYVDEKLGLALTSLGTDRHQQAVIALFQAKTAAELTLGTERDSATLDVPLRADDYGLRPRIRAGSGSTSVLPESNSLAAS